MSRVSYRKFCVEQKSRYCVPENFKLSRGLTDEEGEKALERLKNSFPSEAQSRYNQRDIKKRRENQNFDYEKLRTN
jgi:hypothetical protein